MELQCLSDERAWEALAGPWEALHARSRSATLFNSYPYARLWWKHFGAPGGLRLWLVWEGQRLVAVAPLYQTEDEQGSPLLRFVGGLDVSDYLDLVVEPGLEEELVAALLEGWAAAPSPCTLDLHAVPHASPTREAFLRLAPAAGWQLEQARENVCPVITLPASWEAYLEGLEGKQRQELRRKLRKAGQEALVTWYRVPAAQALDELPHFFALHARSGPDKAGFMDEPMRAFFTELVALAAGQGWLDLTFLLVNGERAATLLAFDFRGERWLYNSGFDPAVGEPLSPGWLLLGYAIEDAIAHGVRRYDFLRGDEAYKYRFGARAEPLFHLRLERQADGREAAR